MADESHQRTTTELPDGWTKEVRDGRDYYANRKTKESSWKPPPGSSGGSAAKPTKKKSKKKSSKKTEDTADEAHQRTQTELPDGWSSEASKDGKKYYANRTSKETSWKPPPGSTGGSSLAKPRRKSARKTEGMVKGKEKKTKPKDDSFRRSSMTNFAFPEKDSGKTKSVQGNNPLRNSVKAAGKNLLGKGLNQMKKAMGGGTNVGAAGAEGTSQAYSGNFSSTGIGLDRYGTGDKDDTNGKSESHRISHGLATAAQVASRQDPRVLAKKMVRCLLP
jgi:hypothetical protein